MIDLLVKEEVGDLSYFQFDGKGFGVFVADTIDYKSSCSCFKKFKSESYKFYFLKEVGVFETMVLAFVDTVVLNLALAIIVSRRFWFRCFTRSLIEEGLEVDKI